MPKPPTNANRESAKPSNDHDKLQSIRAYLRSRPIDIRRVGKNMSPDGQMARFCAIELAKIEEILGDHI